MTLDEARAHIGDASGLDYDDLLMVSELLRMVLKQPSMFGTDESYNEAARVEERLRRYLVAERRRAFRASLRTGGGGE